MSTAPNVHVEIVTLAELLAGPPVDLPPAPRRGGRHRAPRRSDKSNSEPRPYCVTHAKAFRNWRAADRHKMAHPLKRCRLVTRIVKTR